MISRGLKKYLLIKLNKAEGEELSEKDFNEVEEISLNLKDINLQNYDYDFKDFQKFKNLKFLSLQNFNIRNYETNILNRIESLHAVQMSNCKINSKSTLQGNLELISFRHCKNFKLYYISKLKKLKVLKVGNSKKINLKGISYLKTIEKLYFRDIKLTHSLEIANLPNLKYLNLAESKYSKKLEKKLSRNINIDKALM